MFFFYITAYKCLDSRGTFLCFFLKEKDLDNIKLYFCRQINYGMYVRQGKILMPVFQNFTPKYQMLEVNSFHDTNFPISLSYVVSSKRKIVQPFPCFCCVFAVKLENIISFSILTFQKLTYFCFIVYSE